MGGSELSYEVEEIEMPDGRTLYLYTFQDPEEE